jgi:alkanesulfonate monooxygenase SsuD/methylene tetrahydromethanopterin reductase-like flavin-dependent oxidoreductase (luciferase family)
LRHGPLVDAVGDGGGQVVSCRAIDCTCQETTMTDTPVNPVRLSAFSVCDHHPALARDVPGFYREILAQAVRAEELGYDAYWVAEHHFHEYGVVTNPAVFLGAIARETSNLRLGPAVSVLPFHDPVRVAEDYAMVDVISEGRLNMGVGSGYLPHEFEGFGLSGRYKRDRFDESLALIQRLWAGEKIAFESDFHRLHDVALNVLPVQQPGPPITVAALRPEACYHVGRQGFGMMTIPYAAVDNMSGIGQMVADFTRGWEETQDSPAPVPRTALHAHVAVSDQQARDNSEEAFNQYTRTRLYSKSKKDYDDILAARLGLFGSVETVAEQLAELHAMGARDIMLLQDFGAMPHDRVLESMRLFTEEVAPRARERVGAAQAA